MVARCRTLLLNGRIVSGPTFALGAAAGPLGCGMVLAGSRYLPKPERRTVLTTSPNEGAFGAQNLGI